jgi:2'-5' RNA ligase
MEDKARLFVAILCPALLKQSLAELQAALPAETWDLKFSHPDDFHLTLHFLGQTPVRVIDDLKRELAAVAHARRPFDLAVEGLGAFPHWEDPRVVWAGLRDPAGKLAGLFEATRRVLNAYRLFKLEETLNPHITLARVKSLSQAWDPRRLQVLPSRLGAWPVDRMALMQSQTVPEGPKYRVLAEFELKGARDL